MTSKTASEMRNELRDMISQSEAEMNNLPERRLSDQPFEMPIIQPTKRDILLGLFWFDKIEVFLLAFSFFLVWFSFEPFTRENLTNEALVLFWGYTGFFFFTFRHSSSSIFQYLNFRARVTERIRQGKFTVELRFSGMICSVIIMALGSEIAILLEKIGFVV